MGPAATELGEATELVMGVSDAWFEAWVEQPAATSKSEKSAKTHRNLPTTFLLGGSAGRGLGVSLAGING